MARAARPAPLTPGYANRRSVPASLASNVGTAATARAWAAVPAGLFRARHSASGSSSGRAAGARDAARSRLLAAQAERRGESVFSAQGAARGLR